MKRTSSVLLGGMSFQIEEEAYGRLDRYLSDVRRGFTKLPDVEEVMSDIEARIAESLAARPGGEAVVSVTDVSALIAVMGDPEELRDVSDGQRIVGGDTGSGRRPFRNPDDRIVAGVCSGLAAYLRVDTVWVRAAFALAVLAGPLGILGYLSLLALATYAVLWFFVPLATTPSQKMQMHSEPIDLKPLETMARERLNILRNADWSMLRRGARDPFRIVANVLMSGGRGTVGLLLRALGRTTGVVLAAAGAAGIVLAGSFAIALLSDNVPSSVGLYDDHIVPFRDANSSVFVALTLSGFVAVTVIMAFITLSGLSLARLRYKR